MDGDQLFEDLMRFILRANPRDDLARDPIASRLENLEAADRAEIVDRVHDGYSPLFLAAILGLPKIVIHLLDKCGANIENKGLYGVELDHTFHLCVTPLWCAAAFGHLEVCEVLIERGAYIHAVSDMGCTAIHSACFMSKVAVVKYLVDKGANVNRADYSGRTCLMDSVQSFELSEFLILNGANVNARDSQLKTALHYAVEKPRLGTVQLLLRHGADYLAQSRYGDDALQTACLENRGHIVSYLIDNFEYPPERIADAYELLGATFVGGNRYEDKAIYYWEKAVEYRERNNIVKDTSYPTHAVYMGLVPFRTREELHALSVNLDQVRMHGLMINERVLGKSHKDTIRRLINRGLMFAEQLEYERYIELLKYVLDIRPFEGSVLDHEICVAFELFADVLFDRYEGMEGEQNVDWSSIWNDVHFLLEKCINSFPIVIEQMTRIPTTRTYEENWDCLLKTLAHLLDLTAIVPKSEDEDFKLKCTLQLLNRIAPTTFEGNPLPQPVEGSVDIRIIVPSRLAAVEATNQDGSTRLHEASLRVHCRGEVVKSFLGAGAEIDQTNHEGNAPYRMLNENQKCQMNATDFITLKCLAATKVKSLEIKYENQVSRTLIPFVEMHRPPLLSRGVGPMKPTGSRFGDSICMFCVR